MSEENVEIVQRLQPGPDGDLVPLVRDDAVYEAWAQAVAPVFHRDVESVIHVIGAESCTRLRATRSGRPEVEMIAAAVWTLRDGKVAKVAFYPDRSAALQTVGLAET